MLRPPQVGSKVLVGEGPLADFDACGDFVVCFAYYLGVQRLKAFWAMSLRVSSDNNADPRLVTKLCFCVD